MVTTTADDPPFELKEIVSVAVTGADGQMSVTVIVAVADGPRLPLPGEMDRYAGFWTLACQSSVPPPVFWTVSVFCGALVEQALTVVVNVNAGGVTASCADGAGVAVGLGAALGVALGVVRGVLVGLMVAVGLRAMVELAAGEGIISAGLFPGTPNNLTPRYTEPPTRISARSAIAMRRKT